MVENKFSFGMNMIWTFYCAEVATAIKEEASLEIYHSLLATLSWRYYCPSVQDLERMLEVSALKVYHNVSRLAKSLR